MARRIFPLNRFIDSVSMATQWSYQQVERMNLTLVQSNISNWSTILNCNPDHPKKLILLLVNRQNPLPGMHNFLGIDDPQVVEALHSGFTIIAVDVTAQTTYNRNVVDGFQECGMNQAREFAEENKSAILIMDFNNQNWRCLLSFNVSFDAEMFQEIIGLMNEIRRTGWDYADMVVQFMANVMAGVTAFLALIPFGGWITAFFVRCINLGLHIYRFFRWIFKQYFEQVPIRNAIAM